MANIIVDIALAIILLIGVFWGLKKGFVKAIAKPAKFILALLIAISLSSLVGEKVVKPMVQKPIVNKLSESLTAKIEKGIEDTDDLPTLVKVAAELADVDMNSIAEGHATGEMVDAILVAVTDPILNLISSVIAFVLLYIILRIILGLAFAFINSIIDNGPVGSVNRALGCVVMTVFMFMVAWLLCITSDIILNVPAISRSEAVQGFTGGWLYNLFRRLSPIDMMLGLLLSF